MIMMLPHKVATTRNGCAFCVVTDILLRCIFSCPHRQAEQERAKKAKKKAKASPKV